MSLSPWYSSNDRMHVVSCRPRSAERSKRGTDLFREKFRLFPGRKVPALVQLVVMDEFGIRPLCPTPRGCIDLVWKDPHRNRVGDVLGVKKRYLFFPIAPTRLHPRIPNP